MIDWILRADKWLYYTIIILVFILSVYITNQFLYLDYLYYDNLEEQFTLDQIKNIIMVAKKWQIYGYLIIPFVIIIRILYTSFCFSIGNLIQESHWSFQSLFNISLKADIVFCLSPICNFYYYSLTNDYNSIDDLGVNCFSFLKLTGRENIPNWLIMAFNSINLFELIYIVLLIVLIQGCFQISYLKATVFVLLTYCIGNYFYIVGMTFLYLNFS